MDLHRPSALLGQHSPAEFMRGYWQRRPLLVRQAVDVAKLPVEREQVLALATHDDLPSRLVRRPSAAGRPWRVVHGPFEAETAGGGRRAPAADGLGPRPKLPALSQRAWTVLVQDAHTKVPELAHLMRQFRFVPDARLDDVMVSFATRGGGVGPHVDSYDVFLLQARGVRRWRIGPLRGAQARALLPGQPLKLLARFEPRQQFDLRAGDMLYLPPGYGHDGVAQDDHCVTCSIGFRAPSAGELLAQWLEQQADVVRHAPSWQQLYGDAGQAPTDAPERLPEAMVDFLLQQWARLQPTRAQAEALLGRYLSEPKPHVFFDTGADDGMPSPRRADRADRRRPAGLRLDDRTLLLMGRASIHCNGEPVTVRTRSDRKLLERLARQRELDTALLAQASPELQALLRQWVECGWAHDFTVEKPARP